MSPFDCALVITPYSLILDFYSLTQGPYKLFISIFHTWNVSMFPVQGLLLIF